MSVFYSPFIQLTGVIRLPVCAGDRQTGKLQMWMRGRVFGKGQAGVNDHSSIPTCRLFQGHVDWDWTVYLLIYSFLVLEEQQTRCSL